MKRKTMLTLGGIAILGLVLYKLIQQPIQQPSQEVVLPTIPTYTGCPTLANVGILMTNPDRYWGT